MTCHGWPHLGPMAGIDQTQVLVTVIPTVGTVLAAWWAKGAKSSAQRSEANSRPVSNGFVAGVNAKLDRTLLAAEAAQSAAERAERKVDGHIEAHANANVLRLPIREARS